MDVQNITTVSARSFARDQKKIIDDVMRTRRSVVVTNHRVPQVAIVNIKTLSLLEDQNAFNKTKNLLNMAKEAEILSKKFNIKGPKDLSINHDKYGWGPYD